MLSAWIVTLYMPNPAEILYRLSPYWDCWGESCQEQRFWYEALALKIKFITGALWMASWAFLEIRRLKRPRRPTPKLLTHVRYGPIAILVFSIAAIVASDFLLIQYSRWQIVRYIHSDAPVTERPSLELHNNYRHWCGNGLAANEYYLYGDTPLAYIDAPEAATRARALQASMYVYDWINHPNDGPSIEALKKATADPDAMVREVASKFSNELSY
jgi:hypothetical protein